MEIKLIDSNSIQSGLWLIPFDESITLDSNRWLRRDPYGAALSSRMKKDSFDRVCIFIRRSADTILRNAATAAFGESCVIHVNAWQRNASEWQ